MGVQLGASLAGMVPRRYGARIWQKSRTNLTSKQKENYNGVIPARMPLRLHLTLVLGFAFLSGSRLFSDSAESHVVQRKLRSEKIMNNKIGTDPARKMLVYLPAGSN